MDRISTAAALDAIPSPALLLDPAERIIACNRAARARLGAVAGRPLVTVLRQPALGALVARALGAGEAEAARLRIAISGEETPYLVHATPLGPEGAMLVFEDQTALETAEAMRRDFVANVSHELRTPLTALLGFIETLRGAAREDAAARDRFLGIMEREASRMNRLVADLLSLSRVEQEERRRPETPVDLALVLRGAVQSLRPMAQARGVVLEQEGEAGPLPVPADADQITQILTNLLENAVKYGASGGRVRLTLRRIAHDPRLRGPAVAIEVRDFGEGIPAEHLPRLTERFYRVDTHRSREQGGTGLGLAIVKHIVARHRGRLHIDSRAGEGSVFTVVLPER